MVRLALPIYVELLTAVVAVGVIDLLWVSGLGAEAIAAVTVGTTVEYLAYGLFLAVPTGVTVLTGRRDGRAPLGPVVRAGWLLWAVFSAAIAVPGVLLHEPLAALFTDDGGQTAGFLLVLFAGMPVYFAQTVVDGVLKGLGDTRRPMRHALLCNALVVALDPVLIYGLGLGVRGAALATVLARVVTLAVALRTLLRTLATRPATMSDATGGAVGGPASGMAGGSAGDPAGDPIGGPMRSPASLATGDAMSSAADGPAGDPVGDAIGSAADGPAGGPANGVMGGPAGGAMGGAAGQVVWVGGPMAGDFLARALVGMALVDIVAGFGTAELAGYGVGQKVMLAGVMVFYALRQAALIRTARGEPAGRPLVTGLAAGAVVAAVLNVVAEPVAGMFAGDPAAAVGFLRWMTLYLVPFGGLISVGGVLQASGRGGRLLAATLAGFAVQLPLAYLLSARLGVTGVWLSMAAGAALSLAGATARRGSAPWRARGRAPRSTRTGADRPSGR